MPEINSLVLNVKSDSVVSATGHLRTLDSVGEKTTRTVTGLGNIRMAGLVAGLAAVGVSTAALGAAAGQATREWLSFDKAIKEVNSITSQSSKQFATMRRDVLNLSVALGTDATKAAKGLYQALSAGVPRENAIKFLEVASKAAIAGVTDVNVAVDGLTNTINAFKIPVSEAEAVADKLFSTVVQGKTTFEELSNNLSKASVPAAALGVSLDELLGVVIGITKQGTPTSEAFTQVKAAITALLDPSEQMAEVYAKMGVESGRQAIAQFGLIGTLEQVRQAYDGNDSALVKALRSSEAYNGVLSVTGRNLEEVRKATQGVGEATGMMGKAHKENANTLENSLNSLKASVVTLVETMESSYGIISGFTEFLKNVAIAINEFNGGSLSIDTQAILGNPQNTIQNLEDINSRLQLLGQTAKDQQADLQKYQSGLGAASMMLPGQMGNVLGKQGDLNRTISEIQALREAQAGVTEEIRWQYDAKVKLAEIEASTKMGGADALDLQRKKEINEELIQNLIRKREQIELEATAAIAKEGQVKKEKANTEQLFKLKKASEKLEKEMTEAEKKAAKEKKTNDERAIQDAKELATTEKEKIQLKIQELDLLRQSNQISDTVYTKAKANLEGEIKLLDERNVKLSKSPKSGGSSFGGASGGGYGFNSGSDISSLPDISNPFGQRNEYEYLREAENEIIASYERRKEAILQLTGITEEEKLALITESQARYQDIMAQADRERNSISLNLASEFFGNLASMASAFGAKGAKVAKAAAIAQTIIKTYESATSAYASLAGIPYVGPALGAAAAGAAIAAGLANVQAIRSQPIDAGRYATGGIVPGQSPSGDNMRAQVNSGEMILNKSQQAQLFSIANGQGATGGTTVNVVVRPMPGQTADVKQNPSDPNQLEIVLRKVDEKLTNDLQTGSGKFVPALTRRIGDLKKPL